MFQRGLHQLQRHLPADKCHTATYQVPENNAFWSITVYGADGYMKSVDNILNASNTKEACGDVSNGTATFGAATLKP